MMKEEVMKDKISDLPRIAYCPMCRVTFVDKSGGTAAFAEMTSLEHHGMCTACHKAWDHAEHSVKIRRVRKTCPCLDSKTDFDLVDYALTWLIANADAVQEFEVDEPEEPDDRAPCRECGRLISDVEYDDNGGLCNEHCEEE